VAKEYKLTTEIHREKTQSFRREIKKKSWCLSALVAKFVT